MKKTKKKKISQIRSKELKRIKQIIYRAKKLGYIVNYTIKDLEKLSTQKLKTLTAKKIQNESTAYWQGDKISGKEYRKKLKEERQLKRKIIKEGEIPIGTDEWFIGFDNKVLENLYRLCNEYDSSIVETERVGAYMLRDMLDDEISKYGKHAVTVSAEENAKENIENGEIVIQSSKNEEKISRLHILRCNIRGSLPSDVEEKQDNDYDSKYYFFNDIGDNTY